jgi:hypothetical protein
MKFKNLFTVFMLLPALFSCSGSVPAQKAEEHKTIEQKPLNPVFKDWKAGVRITPEDIRTFGFEKCFSFSKIPGNVFDRMRGKSFPENCTVSRDSLRYLKVLHYNLQGEILTGEMVCNGKIAADLIQIFAELFEKKYPVEKIRLIDDYDADDEMSMRDNNSSCFCFRTVAGSNNLSLHALGMAVDVNTFYNPYIRVKNGKQIIQPANSEPYCDRSKPFDYKIEPGDDCCKAFKKRGFLWGGDWKAYKDYQHFYKK